MAKATETRVLAHLGQNPALTQRDRDRLLAKVNKGQKKSRARDITGAVEQQYADQFNHMTVPQQAIVRRAVRDYTADSDAINTSCRQNAPNANALNIDAAFQIYAHYGFDTQQRVVYRLMTYKPPAICPYGAPLGGAHIVAGDQIRDLAFFSCSENRQFLINGIKNPPVGVVYVKFVIIGQGGINISGGGNYTNDNEQLFLKQMHPKTYHFRTADSGQAEILYPRGTVLRIERVAAVGGHVHVAATIPHPQPLAFVGVKNSFTGL